MGLRADRKKVARKIHIGDVVTWGRKVLAHPVMEITPTGVIVDAAEVGYPRLFVAFDDEPVVVPKVRRKK